MIEFYATVDSDSIKQWMPPNVSYLLPASSWSRYNMRPVKLPAHVTRVAADCGGFVASRIWGEYRYTPARYIEWLDTFKPQWAATMDYCCEDEITSGKPGIVRQRQQQTTDNAWLFWRQYREVSWAWVPTIQGWEIGDYIRHAQDMKLLIRQMQKHYKHNPEWRVGIGTLCARASTSMIQDVVRVVSQELPGVPLHLWGVKLNALRSGIALRNVVSVDSAAWNSLFKTGIAEWEQYRDREGYQLRQYTFQIALPRYLEKFNRAVNQPKQMMLI